MADRPLPAAKEPPTARDAPPEKQIAIAAGLAVLWTAFTLLAQFSGALDSFEEPLLDWRASLAAYPEPAANQLALVAIDAIPPDRPWPWSRLEYSLILRSLIDYAPQSVVFDMNLNDRDTDYTASDETFSHIVQRANAVVFAATVLTTPQANSIPANLPSLPFHGGVRQLPRFAATVWPLDTFAGSSPVGANNIESDAGLRLRRIPLVFMLGNKLIPSLVLQAAAQFLGADLTASDVEIGRAIFLRRHDGKLLRAVPIDDEGRMRIRYHQDAPASWKASFDNIMLYDDQLQNGIRPDGDLRDLIRRQVWIGRTDPGDRERFKTPLGTISRVEVELQAERTILDQDYVRPLPPMILSAIYLLIALGGAIASVRFGPWHATAMLTIFAAFWVESSILAFRLYNVILPVPSFGMLIIGALIVGVLAGYWDLESELPSAPPD